MATGSPERACARASAVPHAVANGASDRGDQVGGRDDLHVAVLAHVEVAAGQRAPTDEDVGCALHHPLPGDDALPMVVVVALVRVRLVDRGSGLLELQEEWVGPGASREEHEVDDHADAAHPHHLADHVHRGEAVEERAAVLLEGEPVSTEQVVDDVLLLLVVDGDAQRGLCGDAGPATRHRGQLGEGAAAGPLRLALLDLHLTWPRSAGSKKFMNRSTCMLAYQMSISGMAAKVLMRER